MKNTGALQWEREKQEHKIHCAIRRHWKQVITIIVFSSIVFRNTNCDNAKHAIDAEKVMKHESNLFTHQ